MFTSKLAKSISPYVPGEQPKDGIYVKLNTNENPYPPSPNIAELLRKYDSGKLRLYPDPNNTDLKKALAKFEHVSEENIFVGNGSDEVLAMAFPSFCDTSASFADVTYSFYEVYCKLFKIKPIIVPVKRNFTMSPESYFDSKADMVIICNPNAPTGILMNLADIESIIINNANKVVIIDEAYAAFSEISAVELTNKYKNLLVVKTFSKAFSLAGIRCGYAIGDKILIDALNKVKNSFNSYTVNSVTEKIAIAAIADYDYTEATVYAINSVRHVLCSYLNTLGFKILPSDANFVFCTHPKFSAQFLYEELYKRKILVRYFNKPKISKFLRITVGTPEEIRILVHNLKALMSV